ncbi:MarR family winged helix-turn-helix transcriptional regulator [Streptomyces sp. NBC_01476]|uniref:MarR family winged helix-turn-helix transcriptional regulator n=1 Tax=Streptomyces sp. NBC_01476 TaxID=2903881 RepID=UPI002E34E075|nr:MarR family winged helix-turn-helix transcriptional regulator [Streptomyces sp. NBC_01476]
MNDVRWLTEAEQEIWRAYMGASTEFAAHIDRQLRRESGMPMAYYEILVRLSEAEGRCLRMSDLAAASLSSRSRLSHAVNALEKNGWVERRPADRDRRGWVCRLTEAGYAALSAAAPGHVTTVREKLFDVLTPEQLETLREIGLAISAGLRSDCDRARDEDEQACSSADPGDEGLDAGDETGEDTCPSTLGAAPALSVADGGPR